MALRLAAPVLAAIALVTSLAGAGGFASFLLLSAIVVASVRLLLAVGDAAEGHSDRWPVVMSIGGLGCLVAAGAAHVPLLLLGLFACTAFELFACTAFELLGSPGARPDAVVEPVELLETPVSRAA